MIKTFQEILTSTKRMETNIQDLIQAKEGLTKLNTLLLEDSIQQLDRNIVSNIENQLSTINNQLKLIDLIVPTAPAEQREQLLRLEEEFLIVRNSFETIRENYLKTLNATTQ